MIKFHMSDYTQCLQLHPKQLCVPYMQVIVEHMQLLTSKAGYLAWQSSASSLLELHDQKWAKGCWRQHAKWQLHTCRRADNIIRAPGAQLATSFVIGWTDVLLACLTCYLQSCKQVANMYIAAKAASGQKQAATAASLAEGVVSNQAGWVVSSPTFHAVQQAGMTQTEPASLVDQQLTSRWYWTQQVCWALSLQLRRTWLCSCKLP